MDLLQEPRYCCTHPVQQLVVHSADPPCDLDVKGPRGMLSWAALSAVSGALTL